MGWSEWQTFGGGSWNLTDILDGKNTPFLADKDDKFAYVWDTGNIYKYNKKGELVFTKAVTNCIGYNMNGYYVNTPDASRSSQTVYHYDETDNLLNTFTVSNSCYGVISCLRYGDLYYVIADLAGKSGQSTSSVRVINSTGTQVFSGGAVITSGSKAKAALSFVCVRNGYLYITGNYDDRYTGNVYRCVPGENLTSTAYTNSLPLFANYLFNSWF